MYRQRRGEAKWLNFFETRDSLARSLGRRWEMMASTISAGSVSSVAMLRSPGHSVLVLVLVLALALALALDVASEELLMAGRGQGCRQHTTRLLGFLDPSKVLLLPGAWTSQKQT